MLESPAGGDARKPQLYVFIRDRSSGEQTNKGWLWFSGAADVYLDSSVRSASSCGACVHMYPLHMYLYINVCACCVCVSLCSENKRKREEGESGGLFAAALSA